MIHKFDNLGRVDARAAQQSVAQSTIPLALAVLAALATSVTEAQASARQISASSYGFADSLLTNDALERPPTLSPLVAPWPPGCFVNCGPAFGAYVVQRSDLLTSNTADLSARKIADAAGHPMGVSGMVMIERLESDGSGSLTDWVVVSEHTLDDNGSHSWSLLSGIPSDAPWLPSDLYRFEGSSFSTDLAGEAPATPEASTWVLMLIGFAGLGAAGCRSSKNPCRPVQLPKRDTSR